MPLLVETPQRIEPAGTPPKTIAEYVGRAKTGTERASVAHMKSPSGWSEPGQRPEFEEYTREALAAGGARLLNVTVETDGLRLG